MFAYCSRVSNAGTLSEPNPQTADTRAAAIALALILEGLCQVILAALFPQKSLFARLAIRWLANKQSKRLRAYTAELAALAEQLRSGALLPQGTSTEVSPNPESGVPIERGSMERASPAPETTARPDAPSLELQTPSAAAPLDPDIAPRGSAAAQPLRLPEPPASPNPAQSAPATLAPPTTHIRGRSSQCPATPPLRASRDPPTPSLFYTLPPRCFCTSQSFRIVN